MPRHQLRDESGTGLSGPKAAVFTRGRHLRRAGLLAAVMLVAGCGIRSSDPPEAGYARGGIPDLRGQRVLLLPPQNVRGGHDELERELMFALAERGGGVDWVTPPELRDRMERSPEMGIALDRLQVQSFLSGRVERIGDPLFGEMYRLGALEGSDIALIPVEIRERLVPDQPGNTRVEAVATLIQLRTGRVIWFGVVGGTAGPQGEMAPTASAMEALAREILP